jgi:hypothetical protein
VRSSCQSLERRLPFPVRPNGKSQGSTTKSDCQWRWEAVSREVAPVPVEDGYSDVTYTRNPQGGYVARGVPHLVDEDAPPQ